MDRLSDFELGIGDEIKADSDYAASGCIKLQCNASQLPHFPVKCLLQLWYKFPCLLTRSLNCANIWCGRAVHYPITEYGSGKDEGITGVIK